MTHRDRSRWVDARVQSCCVPRTDLKRCLESAARSRSMHTARQDSLARITEDLDVCGSIDRSAAISPSYLKHARCSKVQEFRSLNFRLWDRSPSTTMPVKVSCMFDIGDPILDQWYLREDTGETFLVMDHDERSGTIEIQTSNGDLDELDEEMWRSLPLSFAEPPQDWTSPIDTLKAEDLEGVETEVDRRPVRTDTPEHFFFSGNARPTESESSARRQAIRWSRHRDYGQRHP
jgi:hypothetical protein